MNCASAYNKQEILLGWTPSKPSWIKLNTDGASKGNLGEASGGGLIQDSVGGWLGGFVVNIGHCIYMAAEFRASAQGLHGVWEAGYRRIVEETDSKVVLHLVNSDLVVEHS